MQGGRPKLAFDLQGEIMFYHVSSNGSWFVCEAETKRKAHSEGVQEWGRGTVSEVRRATDDEIRYYNDIRPGVLNLEEQQGTA